MSAQGDCSRAGSCYRESDDGLTAPESVGRLCAWLRGSGVDLVLGPRLVHGALALWTQTTGAPLLHSQPMQPSVCADAPPMTAVAHMGCCTLLLYGTSCNSKNAVKSFLTRTSSLGTGLSCYAGHRFCSLAAVHLACERRHRPSQTAIGHAVGTPTLATGRDDRLIRRVLHPRSLPANFALDLPQHHQGCCTFDGV